MPTDTYYGGITLDTRNQVAFAKPEARDPSGQRCKGTIVPTIPLGISKVASSTQKSDIYWKQRKQIGCVTADVDNLQIANKVRVDFGF